MGLQCSSARGGGGEWACSGQVRAMEGASGSAVGKCARRRGRVGLQWACSCGVGGEWVCSVEVRSALAAAADAATAIFVPSLEPVFKYSTGGPSLSNKGVRAQRSGWISVRPAFSQRSSLMRLLMHKLYRRAEVMMTCARRSNLISSTPEDSPASNEDAEGTPNTRGRITQWTAVGMI